MDELYLRLDGSGARSSRWLRGTSDQNGDQDDEEQGLLTELFHQTPVLLRLKSCSMAAEFHCDHRRISVGVKFLNLQGSD
jgi:hypothetical protein